MRCEVSMAAKMLILVFWVVIPDSYVVGKVSEEHIASHLRLYSEDEGTMFLRHYISEDQNLHK
jgi:hypothetical protein